MPVGAFRLRDFVFVVREAKIDASAVQIEGFAEVVRAHRGTLNVPAGATLAPRTLPKIRTVFGLARFPQREVGNIVARVFVGKIRRSRGIRFLRAERIAVEVRELAVFGIARNFEIDAPVGRDVGVPAGDEFFDHRNLERNVSNGTRLDLRREHVERGAVVVKLFCPRGGEFGERLAFLLRAANRLVVHISDVADVADAESVRFERAPQNILQQKRAEITDVRGTVNGRSATVHAEFLFGRARRERAH